jgi:hypothetical protein
VYLEKAGPGVWVGVATREVKLPVEAREYWEKVALHVSRSAGMSWASLPH